MGPAAGTETGVSEKAGSPGEALPDMLAQELDKRERPRRGIHEAHGGKVAPRVEEGKAGEAAGGAIVHVDARFGLALPGKSAAHVASDVVEKHLGFHQGRAKRRPFGMQLSFQVSQHVAGCGADAAGAREGVQVPRGSLAALAVVPLHEAAAPFGQERDERVLHAEWAGDLAPQKFRIAGSRTIRQRRPKHREAEIAVEELRVRGLAEAVPLDEGVKIGGAIVSELFA